jgi:hypothetical protein
MVHTLHSFAALSRSGPVPAVATVSTHEYSPSHASRELTAPLSIPTVPYRGTKRARVTAPMGLSVCVGRIDTLCFGFRPQVDDNFDGMIDLAEW